MLMSNEEKIIFLANVVTIARSDGKFTSSETEAIQLIQKTIGARKTELNKAYQKAEITNYKIHPIGSWADQTKNLECMIYLLVIGSTLEDTEDKLIENFANEIGVSENQLSYIKNDIKNITVTKASILCSECKAKINGNAKFCPECGTNIQESTTGQSISYDIPKTGISIEFAESTAGGFANALKDQENAPIHATCLKGKKTWYLASWPKENISDALKIVENLKGMRNRKVYVDGNESQWNDVFGFAWCANERNSAYRPDEYCFGLDEKRLNIWGCKQARMDWARWSDWFSYGSFKQSGFLKNKTVFVFDKKRIRHELENNLFKLRLCPHLQFKLIEVILKNLPDEVTPSENGEWLYKQDYEESKGSIFVKIKVKDGNYSYLDKFHSNGVVPNGVKFGLNILKKSVEECNYPTSRVQKVLTYKE